jgi:hypothetical protein
VKAEYERQIDGGDVGDQEGLDGERALASIDAVSDDVREKAKRFERRETALRQRFQQVQ